MNDEQSYGLTSDRTGAVDDAAERSGEPILSSRPISVLPSRRGYLIAAIVAVLGLIIGVGGLVRGMGQLSDDVDAFDRVDLPGSGTVRFATAGHYTLYYEATGATEVPPFRVVLQAPSGEPVQLTEYRGSFDYSTGDHEGTAVATFHIDTPGPYDLASEASIPPGIGQLAVGKGLGGNLAQTLVPGLVLFLALITAATLAVVTAVRRRRARGSNRGSRP